jgi:hypothetical protein
LEANQQIGFTHLGISARWSARFDCNELTLVNKGTQIATIGGTYPLYPGESITYPGKPGENNASVYDITFTDQGQPGCLVVAICKNFM